MVMAGKSGISIRMNEEEWAKATVSLTEAIQKWSDGVCEDMAVGFWYDDIVFDMARAAIGVLRASTKGQEHYQQECS